MKVIDVSEHNGKIDWKKVKADGIEGVIIRAGYGKGNVDKKFTANITGALKEKLNIGIYWFSYAYTIDMAKREAAFCNEIIAPYKGVLKMPVFFDWEYDSMDFAKKNGAAPDKKIISYMTKSFCEEITSLGYEAGYYLNLDYSKRFYDETILKNFKRWFARYIKTEQKDCYLWQYSCKGKVNGITGDVDMDILYGKLKEEKQEKPKEKQKEKPKTTEKYVVGKTYTVCIKTSLNVRTGPGTNYMVVGYSGLTPDAKKHATKYGALLPDTKVTCLDIKKDSYGNTWMKIPSGWICAVQGNNVYVK